LRAKSFTITARRYFPGADGTANFDARHRRSKAPEAFGQRPYSEPLTSPNIAVDASMADCVVAKVVVISGTSGVSKY